MFQISGKIMSVKPIVYSSFNIKVNLCKYNQISMYKTVFGVSIFFFVIKIFKQISCYVKY